LVISAMAVASLSLAACSADGPIQQGAYADPLGDAMPNAAPADHTLRDGLIGGALGYMAGRASQPRPQVVHVYPPSYTPPAYRPACCARMSRTTTITHSYHH